MEIDLTVDLVKVNDAQAIAHERGYLSEISGMRLVFRLPGTAGAVGNAIIQDGHIFQAALDTCCPERDRSTEHSMASVR